jgi:mono/diheme cytochrome c family protein
MRHAGGLLVLILALAAASLFGRGPQQREADVLLKDAPAKANSLQNPYEGRTNAVRAGAKLFRRHCAKCHGDDASGGDDAPNLHGATVQNATPGALYWFLRNGSLRSGMPSWSRLPDQQRWQLVSYLKTLEPPAKQQ